jgi:hypothetical protein
VCVGSKPRQLSSLEIGMLLGGLMSGDRFKVDRIAPSRILTATSTFSYKLTRAPSIMGTGGDATFREHVNYVKHGRVHGGTRDRVIRVLLKLGPMPSLQRGR